MDRMQIESLHFPRFLKPSHRTRPEQLVGLSIFLLFSATIMSFFLKGLPFLDLIFWGAYHLFLPLSVWTLWRRYSFKHLRVELSLYLAFIALQVFWSLSLFFLQEILLALVALLLLWCAQLLAILLYWKKERLSGILLIPPFLWVFYIMALNMVTCVSKP